MRLSSWLKGHNRSLPSFFPDTDVVVTVAGAVRVLVSSFLFTVTTCCVETHADFAPAFSTKTAFKRHVSCIVVELVHLVRISDPRERALLFTSTFEDLHDRVMCQYACLVWMSLYELCLCRYMYCEYVLCRYVYCEYVYAGMCIVKIFYAGMCIVTTC